MAEETTEKAKADGGWLDKLLGVVKGKWVREVFYNVGGRKLVAAGGGLAVIDRIVAAGGAAFGWPHAVACLAVSFVSVGFAFATAKEDGDKAKAEAKKEDKADANS